MARVARNKEKISKSDKKKFKESFNKINLKTIKELADKFGIGTGTVSQSDLKKLIKKSKE